jgi:hypothetical protein
MRIRTGVAALAVGLILVGYAAAQSSGSTSTGSSFPFNFSLSQLFGWATSSSSSSTKPPVAQPQTLGARNTSLTSFIPTVHLPTPQRKIGMSVYPTEDQMPGADYLKAFGLKVAPRVPIQ